VGQASVLLMAIGNGIRPALAGRLLAALIFSVGSFGIALLAGPRLITVLRASGAGARVRSGAPAIHAGKAGTPVMGGLLFIGTTTLVTSTFNLVGHWSQLLPLGVLLSYGAIGLADDLLKARRPAAGGMPAVWKLSSTTLVAIVIVAVLHVPRMLAQADLVWVPTRGYEDLGWVYWVLAVFATVGTAQAVNLTDGADGLAAGSCAVSFGTFGVVALMSGQVFCGDFCLTMVGAVSAFLWFNVYPARVFMGDTGSLALGGTLATVALLLHQLIILPVIGLLYVLVTFSVMAQVGYFKLSGGHRLLRRAPLQHHLQEIGWHESQVARRLWVLSAVAAAVGAVLAFL
jgi:phospho-N-acetylmuramoyl-pentapeptide-transferase